MPESENVFGDRSDEPSSDVLNYSNVFGNIRIRSTSQALRGGSASTVFGKTEIDLRGATMADGESTLQVSGVFGDATVLLPAGLACSVSATAAFGGVQIGTEKNEGLSSSLSYESPDYVASGKRLRIRASQVFGKVSILQ